MRCVEQSASIQVDDVGFAVLLWGCIHKMNQDQVEPKISSSLV